MKLFFRHHLIKYKLLTFFLVLNTFISYISAQNIVMDSLVRNDFLGGLNEVHYYNNLFRYQEEDAYPGIKCSYKINFIKQMISRDKILLTVNYPPLRQYKIETIKFDVIFQLPFYKRIFYYPSNHTQQKLEDYQSLMRSEFFTKKNTGVYKDTSPLRDARNNYIFSYPERVNLSWDSVPEPPRIDRNSFLQRRSAKDGIDLLLLEHEYETRPNLRKVKINYGPWKFEGTEDIMLSQGYIDNWVKGGESNVSLRSDLRFKANYKKGKNEWENYIYHKFGVISTNNDPGSVNTDMLEINTKYGIKSSSKWYYSFLYNFKTQFFYGYAKSDVDKANPVSGFMAPAYMSFAVGMDYKPNKNFALLLSPLTSRYTIVMDTVKFNPQRFGVSEGKKVEILNGFSLVSNLKYQISKEMILRSRLDAFYQYKQKDADRQTQIDWEVMLDLRINWFLTTRIMGHLRYFTNESDHVQFKEDFNIAFQYLF